ncbi:MAG: hypothetical protein ACRDEB_05410 [Chitinophagaceae bacterium]
MNTRRKFLIQGGLASTALLAFKPFSSLARAASPFTGFSSNYDKLVFLHTSNISPNKEKQVVQYINDLKKQGSNTILLHAGQNDTSKVGYDVTMNDNQELSLFSGDYKIITKGNHRTGIIHAMHGESNVIQKINTLSAYLKKEKNCSVVVCLSGLGYKNENSTDDLTLAKKSSHLDIIIGGHPDNFHANPYIVLNQKNEEVVIHSAADNSIACGIIDLDLDVWGRKKQISFSDRS